MAFPSPCSGREWDRLAIRWYCRERDKSFQDVSLITLRGSRGGSQLLESIGVLVSWGYLTTGDEAIELAYAARSKNPATRSGSTCGSHRIQT